MMGSAKIITLETGADAAEVASCLKAMGQWVQPAQGDGPQPVLLIEPHSSSCSRESLLDIAGVADVMLPKSGHPKLDMLKGQAALIGDLPIGADSQPVVMAGPCSAESEEQIHQLATIAARAGAKILRGGAYKPRTSPYSFRGRGDPALKWLSEAARANDLKLVTEVMSEHDVCVVAENTDMIQIGSRNMQNFSLLKDVGAMAKPVLLKRGMAATVEDWMMSAEHLLAFGARSVVFCERGVQGIATQTRNLLDLGAVALLRHVYGLPVIVDPSHGTGRRDLIVPMARAGLAAGADGVMVEIHLNPKEALSDGPQAVAEAELSTVCAAARLFERFPRSSLNT
jgi:3-deoxy-7-phosphoheptulonate synthase